MKTLFIPASSKIIIDNSKISEISSKLPKKIAIAYSVQYEKQAREIKKILSKNHEISKFIQTLGCSKPRFSNVQAVLLISDGKFHATSLAYETKLPIYIASNNQLEKISETDILEFEKKQKTSYVNFLNSKKVGILISIKPGQENLEKAIKLKNKLKEKDVYLFVCNNINKFEFENFSDIQSWINTACPRLDIESNKIVNLSSLPEQIYKRKI